MKKLIINYTGYDCMSGDLYKDSEGTYFAKFRDEGSESFIYIGKDPDNDPWGSIKTIDKYKDLEIITVGDENLPTEAEKFNYMMLSRLQTDVKYYLGNGNRYAGHLWAEDEVEQIKEMKRLYSMFTDDKKPEWLTWNQILEYEKELVG